MQHYLSLHPFQVKNFIHTKLAIQSILTLLPFVHRCPDVSCFAASAEGLQSCAAPSEQRQPPSSDEVEQ